MADRPHRLTVVVAGGEPIDPGDVVDLSPDFVVAADSGLDRAREVGLVPDLVVGDMDSVSPGALDAHAGAVERHPTAKDATDLELALAAAAARGDGRIVVLGGGGGRLDHLLANAMALATLPPTVEWRPGGGRVIVTTTGCVLDEAIGATVSIIPIGGPVTVEATSGLRWALSDEVLPFGTTRGVSNEVTSRPTSVTISRGIAAIVLPRGDVRPTQS